MGRYPSALRRRSASIPLGRGWVNGLLVCERLADWELTPSSAIRLLLDPMVLRARICHMTVHVDVIGNPSVEHALRKFLRARHNFHVPGHRNRLPPASIRQLFNRPRPRDAL
jgi:hypothetical protein